MGRLLAAWPIGSMPFKTFTAKTAINSLRVVLAATDVPNAEKYRTHDLRRGHAEDIVANGGRLTELLQMGKLRTDALLHM